MTELVTPELLSEQAKRRLSLIAGFRVEAAIALSEHGAATVEVIFRPELAMVMPVKAGTVEILLADGRMRAFLAEDVPVVLAFERQADAHAFVARMDGGGSA